MPRSLPARPSIEFLQKEAKKLLKRHKARDATCCPTLRYHFRFSKSDDDEILAAALTLQEAQHALSLDYGFKSWKAMKSEVERAATGSADSFDASNELRALVLEAVKDRATDIHIAPTESEFKVRYRVDGVLTQRRTLGRDEGRELIGAVADAAKLDGKRLDREQNGRMLIDIDDRRIDIRANVTPVIHGSVAVLRLLDRRQVELSLEQIAMEPEQLKQYRRVINIPNGVILMTGPTGCGKTTTLYATLAELNTEERKIITAEDPVEFAIDGVDQIPIRSDIGLGFEEAIRSALRQDPDVIMVGEIRNLQIASMLVQVALTGHLAFSMLHANECPGALIRLANMGLEPYLITDAVKCVVSQRLLRAVCANCKTEHKLEEGEFASLPLSDAQRQQPIFRGAGCDECKGSGYKGRTAVYSILEMTPQVAKQVHNKDEDAIRAAAIESGWTTLKEAAVRKMLQGVTTPEQVLGVF